MEEFIQSEIENFEVEEGSKAEELAEKRNSRACNWVGTWNNPKMTDEEFKAYLEKMVDNEILQYAIFQREKGEERGTIHYQFFVCFKNPQYFKKVKREYLPQGCHFAVMVSNAERCKAYCSKVDTRVSGPFEVGEFEKQGKRSDLLDIVKLIDEGVSFDAISRVFQSQSVLYGDKLKKREALSRHLIYSNKCRDVEVTYIYGPGGVGKTSGIYLKHGFSNVFFINSYEKYLFHDYNYQDVVVFDEYDGQVKITDFNRMLDIYPLELRALGNMIDAAYSKVYILSNISLSQQYKDLPEDKQAQKEALYRRIHHIIRIDENGIPHKEKETIFRDLKPEEIKLPGLTRAIDKTIFYYSDGAIKNVVCSRNSQQGSMFEVPAESVGDLPF